MLAGGQPGQAAPHPLRRLGRRGAGDDAEAGQLWDRLTPAQPAQVGVLGDNVRFTVWATLAAVTAFLTGRVLPLPAYTGEQEPR
ncbi:hypothetical protein ACFWY5_15885 [Nonomuraea sp. NPDC059007]|uniref:hypothetical protein n=1 Tax=Nonomuraea sp. NPDC059007 TaxID=3346692 RepID=UPI0036B3FD0F